MNENEPMPELCNHNDYSECTPECRQKALNWDEWLKRWVRGDDTSAREAP